MSAVSDFSTLVCRRIIHIHLSVGLFDNVAGQRYIYTSVGLQDKLHTHMCLLQIGDVKRREKCAMMAVVDEGIGNITRLLRKKNLMNNLLIVFTSDNGGSYSSGSSNWPYKGEKTTLWEGGIKVPTFLYR